MLPTATVCPTLHSHTLSYTSSGHTITGNQIDSQMSIGNASLSSSGSLAACQDSDDAHSAMLTVHTRTESTEEDMAAINQLAMSINSSEQQEQAYIGLHNGEKHRSEVNNRSKCEFQCFFYTLTLYVISL